MGDSVNMSMASGPLSRPKMCDHSKPTHVWTAEDVKIYLADIECCHNIDFEAVVLNCSNISHYGELPSGLLDHFMYNFVEWNLSWPDGGFPPVLPSFWKELLTQVKELGIHNLVIHCKAGHGRTGTAAAAIMLANSQKQYTPASAVEFIRDNFCYSCVETPIQVSYLGWIAEKLEIKNDSDEIEPSLLFDNAAMSAASQSNVSAEMGPPNFDWD